jgi:DtxR family Mn-dependent transcriptional regulator
MQKISPEIEEYLETIYRIKEKGKDAKTTEVAEELGVSPPSVSEMFRKMAKDGLIRYNRYRGASLTKKGEEIGGGILHKHRLIQKFLIFLGVRRNVHDQACALEHVVSDEVENAMQDTLLHGPHLRKDVVRLSEMSEGEEGRVAFVMGGRNAAQRLADMGLTPGSGVKMLRASSYGGPLNLSICGYSLALGIGVASKVFVHVHHQEHHRVKRSE